MIYYAGIGSKNTPKSCLDFMTKIGRVCAKKGLILRSGGYGEADCAFERGCDQEGGSKEIFASKHIVEHDWAIKMAREVCWEASLSRMKPYTRSLIIKNMYQVFGDHSEQLRPIKFVVFYCDNDPLLQGKNNDVTRYAVRSAHHHLIPHFNLRTDQVRFAEFIKAYPDPVEFENPF